MKTMRTLTLLIFTLIAFNINAQFVDIDGKDPVFHIKFDSLTADNTHFFNAGTDYDNFTKADGTEVNDTVEAHSWGGGLWSGFDFQEQAVYNGERILPSMFWNSYLSYPQRPQGVAAYSNNGNGGYMGPFNGEAMTIAFYVNVSDSARADTANGAWDTPYFYGTGNWQVAGERIYMKFDPSTMKIWIDFAQGNWTSYGEDLLTVDEWTHIALTIPAGGSRSDMKFYKNGVEVFADEEAGDMSVINLMPEDVGWDGIRIGALTNLWMADYRIYDEVLSPNEVAQFVAEPTGLSNMQFNDNMSAYPMPNNGVFTVEFNDNLKRNINIVNMVGQTVYSQKVQSKSLINVSHLPSGTYFISSESGNNSVSVRKLIIE